MTETTGKPTRKSSPPIKVYCLPQERKQIEANANGAGRTLSTYLLQVGVGYEIHGMVDHQQVEELARLNGDLGRLGGLLKLWLTNDARTAQVGASTLRAVLSRIAAAQKRMMECMETVPKVKSNTVLLPKDKTRL